MGALFIRRYVHIGNVDVMPLYLNNMTAMRYWCSIAADIDQLSKPSSVLTPHNPINSVRALSCIDLLGLGICDERLHTYVDNSSKRTSSPKLACHVHTGPFPMGAFRRLSEEVFISSPELSFLEMAQVLPFPKLVEYGFFLCGTYTLGFGEDLLNDKPPLTTKRKLMSFVGRAGSQSGVVLAKKALRYVMERSASPRETKSTLLLCLPVREGGYAFGLPILNYPINFSKRDIQLFGRPYVVLDLYWKDCHVGIEYDGSCHSDDRQLSKDRRKESELAYKGITVIRIDKMQLETPDQVLALAKKVARAMGKYQRNPTPQQYKRKKELFRCLMG